MKKIIVLLAVVILVTSTTGCGCMRRLRDRLCRGAFCGSTATPGVIGSTVAPAPTPIFVPQAAAPMYGVPCETCYPCDPCCDPCAGGASYGGGWNSDCDCNSSGSYLPAGSIMGGSMQPSAPATFMPTPTE